MAAFTLNPQGIADQQSGVAACTFCGNVEGPFVVVGQSEYIVRTPTGPVKTDRAIQLCAPKTENDVTLRQGCAGTIALLLGYHEPAELDNMHRELLERAGLVLTLEQKLETALREQIKVVPVDDLMKMLRDAQLT